MNEVMAGVYQIPNGFVNLYLIAEPDALTLVDAGLQSGAKLALEAIGKLGRHPGDLKRILFTHSDPDHVAGAAALKAATGAELLISSQDGAKLAEGEAGRPPKGALGAVIGLMMNFVPGSKITPVRADGTLEPDQELPVLGGLRVVATPGHTPGHLAFFAPRDGILFAGDALMALGGRLSWRESPFTWDYKLGLESVRRLEALHPRVVCCGHGDPLKGDALEFPR